MCSGGPGAQDGYWDRGEKVADAVLAALQRIGTDAVPHLLAGLASPEVCIRHAAARALGRIRSVKAVPVLIRLLRDEGEGMYFGTRVCDEAADALGRIGTPRARKAAVQHHASVLATEGLGKWTQERSVEALQRIGSTEAQKTLADWKARSQGASH